MNGDLKDSGAIKVLSVIVLAFGLIGTLSIVFLGGCAPSVRIPVTRPAEINLRGSKKIAVGEIQGNAGQVTADLLTTRLFESNYFEVVDRQNLNSIMREHQLNMSGAVDESTAAQLGKLIGSSAFIFGNSNANYNVERSVSQTYKDRDGNAYRYFYKTGIVKLYASLRVVDLTTGKIIAIKTFSENSEDQRSATNEWPEDPDIPVLIGTTIAQAVNRFMKMIAPYTEYVEVKFERTKTPEGQSGITLAQSGQWPSAVQQFKLATDGNPSDPTAWYNLGVAYEYSYIFDKAIECLQRANGIKPCEKYANEIGNVNRLMYERRKLEAQGVGTN